MEFTCELDSPPAMHGTRFGHQKWPLFQEQPRGMLVMSYHSNTDFERTSKKGLAIVDEPARVIITFLRSFILVTQLVPTHVCSDKVVLTTAVSYRPHAQLSASDQNMDMQLHPYLEEPLDRLVKRIPELRGISPAADQRELAMILQRTGTRVDEFFAGMVDVIGREEITQERLVSTNVNGGMPGGTIQSKERVRDSYLILRRADGTRAQIEEFRMDEKGNRMDRPGLDKGFFMTSGFALSSVHFSSALQWDSRFLHLGDQKIGERDTYVIAFAQLPSEARNTVTMEGQGGVKVHMFTQGIAWIDKANFQIVQMRTDLLAPRPEIGLAEQTTEITFGEVRFADVPIPLWLPRDVSVYIKFTSAAPIQVFHNAHHYGDYRRFRVSTKILTPN